MDAATSGEPSDLPYVLRVIRAHPRLFFAIAFGGAVLAVLLAFPLQLSMVTRVLIAWDAAVALFLILIAQRMAISTIDDIREHADVEDEGRAGILLLTIVAAAASLFAIVKELASNTSIAPEHRPMQLGLAILTILLSWAFVHTIFALHYAHEYYDSDDGVEGGLLFPGDEEPDYWDFLYFSLVIGMTSQVADVGMSSKSIRRVATLHGVIAFFFNVALLALTINIAASSFGN